VSRAGLAVLLAGALVAAAACGGPGEPPAGARPVLFVPGYGEDSGVFDAMREHLEDRGYPDSWLLAVELDPADGANAAAAEGPISEGVDRLLAEHGGGTVDIVAHSMGAASARWYATRLHPEHVRSLTTVVGANHGTDVLCGYAGAGAPDHPVQAGLNGTGDAPVDETPFGRGADPAGVPGVPAQPPRTIRYTTVALPDDEWIHPVASSALAGADELPGLPDGLAAQPSPGNLVFAGPTDHDKILSDDGMFQLLETVLTAAGAS
jgi:pimeloyl-ACP methyl ester carboxylesterase